MQKLDMDIHDSGRFDFLIFHFYFSIYSAGT